MQSIRLGLLPFAIAMLALLAMLTGGTDHSRAQDSQTSVVTRFDWTPDHSKLRIEIAGDPEGELLLLQNPHRIALDLTDTVTAVRPETPEGESPVSGVRDGLTSSDRYRLLFELREPVVPSFTTSLEGGRTVIELTFHPATPADFQRAVAERAGLKVRPRAVGSVRPEGQRRFTVVIDPGHGGADYGAIGEGGTLEKELNLAFAKVLREALNGLDDPVDVVMTREDDVLIPLAERSAAARRARADLFVSIHADSIRHRDLRGATVYTLSLNASDQLASEVAQSENAADRFAGPEWTQDTPEIHDILVDLVKRETEHLSRRFADELVMELRRGDVRLINNPIRSAGFRVLMAPDVPSVLLEMGYLSNTDDEALMLQPEWQRETAHVVAAAIRSFLDLR